jgi:hypothetical protein
MHEDERAREVSMQVLDLMKKYVLFEKSAIIAERR